LFSALSGGISRQRVGAALVRIGTVFLPLMIARIPR
jgi:hypothetical protein